MDEVYCQYGCGQPSKVWGQRGDLPRCAKKMSDCPVVKRAAKVAHNPMTKLRQRLRGR